MKSLMCFFYLTKIILYIEDVFKFFLKALSILKYSLVLLNYELFSIFILSLVQKELLDLILQYYYSIYVEIELQTFTSFPFNN